MNNLLSIPNKEKDYQRYMIFSLTIIWSVVTGVIVSIGFIAFPEIWHRWLTFLFVSLFLAGFNLLLISKGHVKIANWSLTIMLWLYITIPCYSAGGIQAPGIISQMSVILTAGFLLGWRGGFSVGLITMGVDFWLAWLEVNGQLPEPSVYHTPYTRWIGAIIPFGTILALQYYSTDHLRSSLMALQREILQREKAEEIKNATLYDLKERIKELKTLYAVSRLLQDESLSTEEIITNMAQILPDGWQYPDITAARVWINNDNAHSPNFRPSPFCQKDEHYTSKGTRVGVEIVYLEERPEKFEGPFMKEERDLIRLIVQMLQGDVERRERSSELKDYKYALDVSAMVSISTVDGNFTFVNDNFCAKSNYSRDELLGSNFLILQTVHELENYQDELSIAMKEGLPYRGEFCNRAKDGSLYWVDSTIVPFIDVKGNIYQFLSINHDITEKKLAQEKIRQSELTLRKVTSHIPGNTYMFEIDPKEGLKVLFINQGNDELNYPNV